ncbi:acetyl-CoA carboxylase biotin carboxylase subunit [Candidatus Methylacidithermus pantelleriae]|uniref:Biotin carboxylase n=1 Tax=Candidatus Methylacidithermus pantelleriae TaxID=2744239 RepID=A0A8J2FN42_9BACT|nr:acetyl-CoA carboxylase biotin carboxylase subunit [Candidatus Methylacidithermus pantelleriae]CAF0689493.1 Pyruvate carboxylase, biotin carboxylase [Candidatus Methylacidithermus pantelleriae]
MFKKVLVANRGEIAVRIIRACKELGIRTLAVYSDCDAQALHVRLADEAVCIGPGPSTESYLKIDRIISAAEIGDVDALHPGYGFLAENPYLAEICQSCKITFIGPPLEAIRTMGNKALARSIARRAGVPVVPGSEGTIESEQDALRICRQIGYPVLIKAAAGGGGRGMRVAHNDVSLLQAFVAARMEAEKSFGNGELYVERLIEKPRHVEFQILADRQGKIIHLGERDCSIQRRHQKLVEECPSPGMDPALRRKMGRASVRIAEAVGYQNVGTVEFLVDRSGNFYFIEMNTRIQVEHPVTEEAYGVDLVKQQILLAAGVPLGKEWDELVPSRHAIELRINAEDPLDDFRPYPGTVTRLHVPGGPGVRFDSFLVAGSSVPPYYDSLLGKLIAFGENREVALQRLARALEEMEIVGVPTTLALGRMLVRNPDFRRGDYSVDFLEELLSDRKTLWETASPVSTGLGKPEEVSEVVP